MLVKFELSLIACILMTMVGISEALSCLTAGKLHGQTIPTDVMDCSTIHMNLKFLDKCVARKTNDEISVGCLPSSMKSLCTAPAVGETACCCETNQCNDLAFRIKCFNSASVLSTNIIFTSLFMFAVIKLLID